jgi:hypothetical protein
MISGQFHTQRPTIILLSQHPGAGRAPGDVSVSRAGVPYICDSEEKPAQIASEPLYYLIARTLNPLPCYTSYSVSYSATRPPSQPTSLMRPGRWLEDQDQGQKKAVGISITPSSVTRLKYPAEVSAEVSEIIGLLDMMRRHQGVSWCRM